MMEKHCHALWFLVPMCSTVFKTVKHYYYVAQCPLQIVSFKPCTVSYLNCSCTVLCCSFTETACLEQRIRSKLKDIMMTVDLEEVTSKYVRSSHFCTLTYVWWTREIFTCVYICIAYLVCLLAIFFDSWEERPLNNKIPTVTRYVDSVYGMLPWRVH